MFLDYLISNITDDSILCYKLVDNTRNILIGILSKNVFC